MHSSVPVGGSTDGSGGFWKRPLRKMAMTTHSVSGRPSALFTVPMLETVPHRAPPPRGVAVNDGTVLGERRRAGGRCTVSGTRRDVVAPLAAR